MRTNPPRPVGLFGFAADEVVADLDHHRRQAARLAVELAEENIRAALTIDDEKRLQQSLVKGLEA